MRPNAIKILAMQRTTVRTNVVQRFVCSHEWCTIFKDRKTSRSCLCVCCATMRLLLNMLHVIVQRFMIIARFISFNLPCCATSMYTMYKHLCFDHGCCCTQYFHFLLGLLFTLRDFSFGCLFGWHFLSTEKSRKRSIYICLLWIARAFIRSNARSYERRTSNRNGARSVVRSLDHSRHPIALPCNTRFHCTTVAYKRKTYRTI